MSEDLKDKKKRLLAATEKGIDELIKVIESPIITHGEDDLSADKMKNAAAAKRLAFEDALEMLRKVEEERNNMKQGTVAVIEAGKSGFAESRAKGGR